MSEEKENQDSKGLEQGTYEIIRNRLNEQGTLLKSKIEFLNDQRKAIFGGIETKLVATEHIATQHSCVARDMVPVGNAFIFGYNVHIGLKTETSLDDVFSIYGYENRSFKEGSLGLISDETFVADFKNLYKYYRDATFSKFVLKNGFLYFVFQIGKDVDDIKTFKWAINSNFTLTYVDSRSEHEVKPPSQHGFVWKKPNQDHFRHGTHPHISIEDKVFVETVGGDLTIKVEDNTDTGLGIYVEPVEHADQTLNDAEVAYAIIGDIIVLKILPYQEKEERFILYNHKLKQALRIDALKEACVLLPEDQGIIFPQGYYLQSGEHKLFDFPVDGMLYEKCISASNGEDYLYVFYNPEEGKYTLLMYNIIEQQLDAPIHCHGYSMFSNGELCLFRSETGAQKHHSIQIWQTPYAATDEAQAERKEAYLYKVGNRAVVTAMAECRSVAKLIDREDTYASIYIDLSKSARTILDAYHWISHEEAGKIAQPLEEIERTAKSAIAEFDKVNNLKKRADEELVTLNEKMHSVRQKSKSANYQTVDHYVETLTNIRSLRGEFISAKEIRYMDVEAIDKMEEEILELQSQYAQKCVEFLLTDDALKPYELKVDAIEERLQGIQKVVEADELDEDITRVSGELELLIEIVNSLEIKDGTVTTKIIDNITDIFYRFNRIIADLKKKRKSIFGDEAEAEFKSQLKLIQQGASNYINLSDTPEKSEDYLNRLIIQLEELEGKFSDFPEFGLPLAEARDELLNAFESHKLSLVEARNNRALAIQKSATRILQGISNRLNQYKNIDEINAYLASDSLVQKVRDNIEKLIELDDSVKADELKSQLKSLREDAVRQLRDKTELFAEGDDIIKMGNHHFSVNTKKLDVTMVQRDGEMYYHLTGTNFFEKVVDVDFQQTKHFWSQSIVSENELVYRGEYLAYSFLEDLKNQEEGVESFKKLEDKEQLSLIQKFMGSKYDERYVKGIHDIDALNLLKVLMEINQHAELLIFHPKQRALARFFWKFKLTDEERQSWNRRMKAHGLLQSAFKSMTVSSDLLVELNELISNRMTTENSLVMATYLFQELGNSDTYVFSPEANELRSKFKQWLKNNKLQKKLDSSLDELNDAPDYQLQLVREWLKSFLKSSEANHLDLVIDEVAVSILAENEAEERLLDIKLTSTIKELVGEHPSIQNGELRIEYHAWSEKMYQFHSETVPAYRKYVDQKHALSEQFKEEIKLHSFEPKIMSSFVRNRLINEVYLPLIGNNMAKQMGTVGNNKRTDLMGMLLLISPPGYGKTTLMEYISQRLGLIFVKINGPALGHEVTSVDPASAPNSAAREELNRLNLAFEMGDNVMIYIDDIQHCNSEFLQKFISLCDAQRKIEGVYKGKTKTYDFRGRKMMIVMAGNPYTESGDRFQIPDMLANRSDIYNLGDVIGGRREAFEMSYVENCLTSNSLLNTVNTKSFNDIQTFLKIAVQGPQEDLNLEGNYTSEEMEDVIQLLKRVLQVRDVVTKVNEEYIVSASMEDAYREKPAFKLQGSYRDMNKIVEKLVPLMNDAELRTLILSHYENESQTLTKGAEANLLRFKELYQAISPEEAERWNSIKSTYLENKRAETGSNMVDPLVDQMREIAEALRKMREN